MSLADISAVAAAYALVRQRELARILCDAYRGSPYEITYRCDDRDILAPAIEVAA